MKLGRQAHEHQSKVGQSWRSIVKKEYDEYGQLTKYEIEGPMKCPDCGGTIRYDKRGVAACDCGLIWNDRPERPISEADLQASLEKWTSRACEIDRFRKQKKFKKMCKFGAPGV